VTITVADDGRGMPAEVAAAPFEHRRVRRTKTAGAGLGLSIARGIVLAHGGQIELSQPATGTTFIVRLPIEDGAGLPVVDSGASGYRQPATPEPGPPQGAAARQRLRRGAAFRA